MTSPFYAGFIGGSIYWVVVKYSNNKYYDLTTWLAEISQLNQELNNSFEPQSNTLTIKLSGGGFTELKDGDLLKIGVVQDWNEGQSQQYFSGINYLWRGNISQLITKDKLTTITISGDLSNIKEITIKDTAGKAPEMAYSGFLSAAGVIISKQLQRPTDGYFRRDLVKVAPPTTSLTYFDGPKTRVSQRVRIRRYAGGAWSSWASYNTDSIFSGSQWQSVPDNLNDGFYIKMLNNLNPLFFNQTGGYIRLTAIARFTESENVKTYQPAGITQGFLISGADFVCNAGGYSLGLEGNKIEPAETTTMIVKYPSRAERNAAKTRAKAEGVEAHSLAYIAGVSTRKLYFNDVGIYDGSAQPFTSDLKNRWNLTQIDDFGEKDPAVELERVVLTRTNPTRPLNPARFGNDLIDGRAVFKLSFNPPNIPEIWENIGVNSDDTMPVAVQYQEEFKYNNINVEEWTKDRALQAAFIGDCGAIETGQGVEIVDYCPRAGDIFPEYLNSHNVINVAEGGQFEQPADLNVTSTDQSGEQYTFNYNLGGVASSKSIDILGGCIYGGAKIQGRQIALKADTMSGSPALLKDRLSLATGPATNNARAIFDTENNVIYNITRSNCQALSGYSYYDFDGAEITDCFTTGLIELDRQPKNIKSPFIDITPLEVKKQANNLTFAINQKKLIWEIECLLGFCTVKCGDTIAAFLPEINKNIILCWVQAVQINPMTSKVLLKIIPMDLLNNVKNNFTNGLDLYNIIKGAENAT